MIQQQHGVEQERRYEEDSPHHEVKRNDIRKQHSTLHQQQEIVDFLKSITLQMFASSSPQIRDLFAALPGKDVEIIV